MDIARPRAWRNGKRELGACEKRRPAGRTLSPRNVEMIFGLESQAQAIATWARQNGVKRVVIADFSKNLYATYQGCDRAGLRVDAIADGEPAFAGMIYRGVPVLEDAAAIRKIHGVVISNVNPAQIDRVAARVSKVFRGPILRLWQPATLLQKRWAA